MKRHLPIIIILIIAIFLRFYHLGSLPISLFGDEVDVGYHAWSLWTTLRDYTGHLLPTYISSLAESRAPLLMYVTAPFVGILGLSAFSTRLPVALLGLLNIYLLYLLVCKLFKSNKLGLIAAFILTITPWHIHYSRAAFEVTLLLSLLLGGTYLFLKWTEKPIGFPIWPLPFVLTFYTYSTANIFTPLLVLSLVIIYRPKLKYLLQTTTYILLMVPIGYQLLFGSAAGRFNLISIFNDPQTFDDIITQRTDPLVAINKLDAAFYNRPFTYITVFGKQYLQAFSSEFLFIQGDTFFRQSVGRFGELPWLVAPFLILGVASTFFVSTKATKFLLIWLLLAPIPSALTQNGGAHATRLFIMLPPLIIFSAVGWGHFIDYLSNLKIKYLLVIGNWSLVLLATFFVANYWHRYTTHYRVQSAKVWSYGYEQAFTILKDLHPQGRIFINNSYEPSLIRFAFYTRLPPQDFQKLFQGDKMVPNILPNFEGFRFGDNYYFGQIHYADVHRIQDSFRELMKPGDLYLAVQLIEIDGAWDWMQSPPEGLKGFGQVKAIDGKPLFTWVGPEPVK